MALIVDGKALAQKVRVEIKTKVDRFGERFGVQPHLVVVLASDDPASAVYVRNKAKACAELGIRSTQYTLAPTAPAEELLALVHSLNLDPDVDGILVQLPLPKQHDTELLLRSIDPQKDVDGLHPANAGLLARGDENCLIPCTPKGCIRLIEEAGVQLAGKNAVVLGRSRLVGRPVADLLTNRHATVTVCHSKTRDLPQVIGQADVLVAAIGKPELVKGAWLKFGATVIDVGTNRVASGKLVGDVAFLPALERAAAITPVPGGVGPMTITYLLDNTVIAAERRRGSS